MNTRQPLIRTEHWSMDRDPAWRPAVYGLIERNGKVLMVRDGRSVNKFWELPGGGMEYSESVDMSLIREFKEETGYTVRPLELLACDSWVFENSQGLWQTVSIVKRVELTSEERDTSLMNIDDRVGEVEEVRWVPKSELSKANVVPLFHEVLDVS